MKKLVFIVALVMFGCVTFANNGKAFETPKMIKMEIANLEILNLDKEGLANYLFKKNNCKTGGYSFFSPFYENAALLQATYTTSVKGKEISVTTTVGAKNIDILLKNFVISADKTTATFLVERENIVFKSKLVGQNLTEAFIMEQFSGFDEASPFQMVCPPCVVLIVAIIADTASDVCINAQKSCLPCNGKLIVGACSCSCEPK